MKKISTCFVVLIALALLSGCGSITPVKIPMDGAAVLTPSQSAKSGANVTVVLLQEDRSLFGITEGHALEQTKEMLDNSKHFGSVTIDEEHSYTQPDELPAPNGGEYLVGVTIDEKEYFPSHAAHIGKVFLNMATLTISSTIIPFNIDHSSVVTLTLVDDSGVQKTFSAEAIARNSWNSWSFGQLKTLVGARVLAHVQSMTSAVNQLVADTSTPLQRSAMATESGELQ